MGTSWSVGERPVFVDTTNIKRLAKDLRLLDKELYDMFRLEMKQAGRVVAEEAKKRSGEFSTRIPGSIKVSVTGFGTSVKVTAGGAKAPHAAAIENQGKGFVRHPVFEVSSNKGGGGRAPWSRRSGKEASKAGLSRRGGLVPWTNKNSPPAFLAPAMDDKAEEVSAVCAEIVDKTFKKSGFD